MLFHGPLALLHGRVGRAAMFNTITYTLEDRPTGFVPEAAEPVICDRCEEMLHGHGKWWSSLQWLRASKYTFTVIDYKGASTDECWCCHTRAYMGRHLVEMTRKQKAA